jgi:hypothetical protein
MRYIVLAYYSLEHLVKEVNQKMDEGYTPLGGVSGNVESGYCQAMLKIRFGS